MIDENGSEITGNTFECIYESSALRESGRGFSHMYGSLDEYLRFERLLSELSTKFINLPAEQVDEEIETSLKFIVDHLHLDQGELFEFSDDGKSFIRTHVYSSVTPDARLSDNLSLKAPYLTKILRRGERIVLSRRDEIPEKWSFERCYVDQYGIKSCVWFPLKVGGAVLGALNLNMLHSEVTWPQMLIIQMGVFAEVFGNALSRKNAHSQIQDDMKFEKMLSEISTRFINLPAEAVDRSIEDALQQFLDYFNVDRAELLGYDQVTEKTSLLYQRCRKGVQSVPHGKFPWILEILRKESVCSFSSLDDIPADAVVDRQSLEKINEQAALIISLKTTGRFIGSVSISSLKKKQWTKTVVQRSRLIGEIFASALERKKDEAELQSAFSKIKQLKKQIEGDYNYLREEIKSEHDSHEIVGESAELKQVMFKIGQVAQTEATVLVLGETGTGKELVAQAIHNGSPRKDRPLVKINCAALSPTLIESELFGHEKGAFTGADRKKTGRFETAHGSSLMLDEIGELPLELQAKFLRVLQDGKFERMGSSTTIEVDVRIIAATNKDLEKEVEKGCFRQDLLYRLNVFPITIPPLRKRKGDIPLLVRFFVEKFSKKLRKSIRHIPEEIMMEFEAHDWPGNIRELENVIERALITTEGSVLQLFDRLNSKSKMQPFLRQSQMTTGTEPVSMDNVSLEDLQRIHITRVLEQTDWKVQGANGAAQILDVIPSTLRSKIKKLGIKRSVLAKKTESPKDPSI